MNNLRNDIQAGVAVSLVTLPMSVGMGMIAFAPLGTDYIAMGVLAGLYAAIFLSILPLIFPQTQQQFLGPSPISSGIFAGILILLLNDSQIIQLTQDSPETRIPLIITLALICSFLAGITQMLIGIFRLGEIIKLIPHPVFAGVINGIALKIIFGQFPMFVGLANWQELLTSLQGESLFTTYDVCIGIFTLMIIILSAKFIKKIPSALIGIGGGVVLYYLLPIFVVDVRLAPTIGYIPAAFPTPTALPEMIKVCFGPNGFELMGKVLGISLSLGLLGSVSALLIATIADTLANARHDSRSELVALGFTNAVVSLFVGIPGAGSVSRVVNNFNFGGRSKIAPLSCGLFTLLIVSGGGEIVGKIPLSVMAAVLIHMAFGFFDKWSLQMGKRIWKIKDASLRQNIFLNLAIVVIVLTLTLFSGLVMAISVGMIASFFVYLYQSQQDVIRRKYSADRVHSKTVRATDAMQILESEGNVIRVIELQGSIFFGTADRLSWEIEKNLAKATTVILDFKRVNLVDSSGALLLKKIDLRLKSLGVLLLYAYLPEGGEKRAFFKEMGFTTPETEGRIHEEINTALEKAENKLLESINPELISEQEISLHESFVLRNFTKEEVTVISAKMECVSFPAGVKIIAEGDVADGFHLLVHGRVSVVKKNVETDQLLPLVNFGPGVSFGEIAILRGGIRTADVYSTTPVICYFMSLENFETLKREMPQISNKLLINIGISMANRLAASTVAISELEM